MNQLTTKPYKGNEELYAQRNKELIKDTESGMSMRDRMIKYGLSDTRIRVLLTKAEIKSNNLKKGKI